MQVLIASNDLDVYQLIKDILEITFKGVTIDRALDSAKLSERLSDSSTAYNLILVDTRFNDHDESTIPEYLRRHFPQFIDRTVVVLDADDRELADETEGLPVVYKPFSLDEFDQVVRAACVSNSSPE